LPPAALAQSVEWPETDWLYSVKKGGKLTTNGDQVMIWNEVITVSQMFSVSTFWVWELNRVICVFIRKMHTPITILSVVGITEMIRTLPFRVYFDGLFNDAFGIEMVG
jgi:hypothetical protein